MYGSVLFEDKFLIALIVDVEWLESYKNLDDRNKKLSGLMSAWIILATRSS